MRGLYLLGLAAGCYHPDAATGIPCSADGACPSGQLCVAGVCGLTDPRSPIDAALDAVAPDAATRVPWVMPTLVPGVNSSSTEDDPSWTSDRLTIVFSSNRNGNFDLFIGTRATTADRFVVKPLDSLNSTADESSPEISPDGTSLYFTSDRKVAGSGDVYVSLQVGSGWGPAIASVDLSSDADDGDVALSPDGLTAMVARSNKLWLATRTTFGLPFSTPVVVPSLAVAGTTVAAPSLTNHADAVYFHAGTVRDLYYATRTGDTFTTPVPLTELNTAGRDDAPFVLGDERHLLFARDGDIYETSR